MVKDFWRAKRRSLLIVLFCWLVILLLKIYAPEYYGRSRYTLMADLSLIFGLPVGIAWDWYDFKKKNKSS